MMRALRLVGSHSACGDRNHSGAKYRRPHRQTGAYKTSSTAYVVDGFGHELSREWKGIPMA